MTLEEFAKNNPEAAANAQAVGVGGAKRVEAGRKVRFDLVTQEMIVCLAEHVSYIVTHEANYLNKSYCYGKFIQYAYVDYRKAFAYLALLTAYERNPVYNPRVNGNNLTTYSYVPLEAVEVIAEVLHEGAVKYGERNWEKGLPVSNCVDHGMAHMAMRAKGDTSEPHLAHALCNYAFAVTMEAREKAERDKEKAESFVRMYGMNSVTGRLKCDFSEVERYLSNFYARHPMYAPVSERNFSTREAYNDYINALQKHIFKSVGIKP